MMKSKILMVVGFAALVGGVSIAQNAGQAGRNWVTHQGDQGGTRFSTLNQINVANVSRLRRAWTFHTGSARFASAPMVVDSVMYFSAPNGVYAIDAVTGAQIWKYAPAAAPAAVPAPAPAPPATPQAGAAPVEDAVQLPPPDVVDAGADEGAARIRLERRRAALRTGRGANGVAPRIYSTTAPGLAAIDAKTGALVTSFGENGILPGIRPTSPAVIYRNVLITQGGVEPGQGQHSQGLGRRHRQAPLDVLSQGPAWRSEPRDVDHGR